MDWLTNLLKHFEASRTLVAVVFAAALVQYIGPRLAPTYVDPVPQGWGWLLGCVLLLTGGLSLTWIAQSIRARTIKWQHGRKQERERRSLGKDEAALLLFFAEGPTKWHSLDAIDYEEGPYTKLEVAEMAKRLERVELVTLMLDQSSARLTDEGTKYALQLQNQESKSMPLTMPEAKPLTLVGRARPGNY